MRSPEAKSIKLNMGNRKRARSDFRKLGKQVKESVALLGDGKIRSISQGIRDVMDNIKSLYKRTASGLN